MLYHKASKDARRWSGAPCPGWAWRTLRKVRIVVLVDVAVENDIGLVSTNQSI